jgi:hypothetical protein
VEDGGHLINRQHVVGVEGVNGTFFGVTERAGARYVTQHEEAEAVGVDGRRPIYELACFVVLIKSLHEEVGIVSQ